MIDIFKMHGAGNDYVFIDCRSQPVPDPAALAIRISDRHRGVGSDGLVLLQNAEGADLRMRIFNADGTEAEMCGNAARCAARYAWDCGWVNHEPLRLQTAAGLRILWNGPQGAVTVVMGRPAPLSGPAVQWQGQTLSRLSVGNPHGVLFCEDTETFPLQQAAEELSRKVSLNLEAVQPLGPNRLKVRVWERGSGETWACGTGASAVTVACIMLNKAGKKGEPLNVHCKGGLLKVTHELNDHVTLEGNAVAVFDGVIDIPESIINE